MSALYAVEQLLDMLDRSGSAYLQTASILARSEFAALRTRIAELEALTTWQPIETAPKDVEILVEDDDGVIHHVEMENGAWVSLSNKLEEVYGIVNWMQLPKPPEEK